MLNRKSQIANRQSSIVNRESSIVSREMFELSRFENRVRGNTGVDTIYAKRCFFC